MNSKGNGLKKISIRILFPLIFSGAVTACVIALILFFSDYFWDRIYDNARTDMERQLESFSYNVESEIYHMIDLVNETCYQGMKAKDYLSEEFSEEMSLLYSHNRDKINSISLYDTDGRILWESGEQSAGTISSKSWFQDAKNNMETICFGNPCLQTDGEKLVQVLPVSRLVDLTGNGVSSQGVLVICFSFEELYSALESGFNIMSGKIKDLLERSIAQEKEKRYMERRLLQAQISPHFLYNTLDSIIWMIQGKQYEGAEKMVSLLAKFFRVALSKGEDIITLKQEIQHAISYLGIQNIRFQDKFSFELDIDESLMEYQCPKITIQPILENAIYHGMENAFDDGEIILSVQEKGEDICIEVIDNGEGMTSEQIKQILAHAPAVSSGNKGSGVGVYNVDHRIKLLYGEKYGISIDSELDEGTTVRILIPKVSGSVE